MQLQHQDCTVHFSSQVINRLSCIMLIQYVVNTQYLKKYIFLGLSRAQASKFHEEKLNFNLTDQANHGINPSHRSAERIKEVWLQQRQVQLYKDNLYSVIQKYIQMNPATTRLEVEEDDEENFAIVLVTDLMMRCHQQLKTSSKVVFVTTIHVERLNIAVTPLLCAGPIGAVPLGIIFTSTEDGITYKRGKAQ